MVRRKKPKITGEDPNYSHTFERLRPVESDMPPDVKIPGVDGGTARAPEPPKADAPAKKADAPTTNSKAPTPKKTPAKPRAKKPSKPAAETTSSPDPGSTPKGYRQVTLDAAVKVDHAEAIKPLLEKGLKQRDIIMLAGRRATEQFVLSPTYIPKPEGNRLPMAEGYHTSKRLDGPTLDAMRDEHDPLRVRSDPAMVRGQFETLFWSVLDDVIAELLQRYS